MGVVMVEQLIKYTFIDKNLLNKALTHPSAAASGGVHYERLEFLGDAVLDIVISEYLFNHYPDEQEGALAKRRSALVRGDMLCEVSEKLGLGAFLKLGKGEEASGGRENKANLANVFEAIIGAIYLDGGIDPAKEFLLKIFKPLAETMIEPPKDAKTSLQEWAQANKRGLPTYKVVKEDGPAHAPIFTIEAAINGADPEQGTGHSKREAEQVAAQKLMDKLSNE
jgi:ribonuclease-3